MNTLIYCENCNAWREGSCSRGFPTEPVFFRYCFLTEGHIPAGDCPEALQAGKEEYPPAFPSEDKAR